MRYMTMSLRFIGILLLTILSVSSMRGADNDSLTMLLNGYVGRVRAFAERMPREKVAVHLDNTGYYRGDKIWFQCYVVDGISNAPTQLSHTLYVELLNPRGKIVGRQILKIENGRCHGAFNLTHLPFYSGFYEIRAYTKYMLNFGDAAVFSRVIPVFDLPAKAGDYAEQKMARGISRYPGARPATKAGDAVEMRFFPEGGSLVAGIRSRVAFEITGRGGRPLEGQGSVIDNTTGDTVATIQSLHEGRGFFEITPKQEGDYRAVIECGGVKREHKFSLPRIGEHGAGLRVDNVSSKDSILVTISPHIDAGTTPVAGIAVTARGALWSYTFVNLRKERNLKFSTREMPSGVSVITLFDPDGRTMAERMVFVNNGDEGKVSAAVGRVEQDQHGKMTLDITATDQEGLPAALLPLSVSVTDGDNAVDYHGGLLADLLLTSEIKGYVRNPMQYFGDDSADWRRNLDLLMMVSGWRNYSWEEMAASEPERLRYYPEEAIDMEGQVVSFVRRLPKAGTEVSVMVTEHEAPDTLRKRHFMDRLTTDSCGRFSLSYDLSGKWDLLMTVSEKGKNKDHRVILDRLFSPAPRKYEAAEMMVERFSTGELRDSRDPEADESTVEDETDNSMVQLADSLAPKAIKLDEVVVKGKRNREADIYKARSKSVEYYDMQEELGDLADKGKVVGNDLFDVLKNLNPGFNTQYAMGEEKIRYKTKKPLFVINYERTYDRDSMKYKLLYPESIKSIFITEDAATMLKYADPHYTMFDIEARFGCAVLIETFPEQKGPPGRGTRHQIIEGYTAPSEYQNIDSELLLDNPDLRRTLYWNPELTTGPDGKAHVEFFGNPTCRNMRVSIQGVDGRGTIYSN